MRRAWLLTKLAALVVAAAATWGLARLIGPRAWLAYAAFVAVLALTTLAGLAAARAGGEAATREPFEDGDEEVGVDDDPEAPVVLPVEDALDLHPFRPDEIPDVVRAYLEQAVVAGFAEVRLIHGRGIGVQRERVRSVLASHPAVLEYRDAPPQRGGWGATVARLRARRPEADQG